MEDVSLIVTIFTLFLLTLVCIYGMYLAKRERSLRRKQDELHRQVQNTLKSALDQADHMLINANEKVREMVNHAHNFNTQMEQRATDALSEVGRSFEQTLRSDLSASEREYDAGYRKIMDEMRAEFKKMLAEQLRKSQELTTSFTEEQFDRITAELSEYERTQKKDLAVRVGKLIEYVLTETLKKTLTPDDHRKLIDLALQSIEKDGKSAHSASA